MITRKELAQMYKISRNTLNIRLGTLGIRKGIRICPKDLQVIFEELGKPTANPQFAQ